MPLDQAARFQVYRPAALRLASGDRVRITANGKTQDGRHKLANGTIFTLKGFTPQGHLVMDNGWVIDREFGHLAHGYVVTSHASQGKTVDQVFIGQSSLSFPASGREQFYVSVSRARDQAVIFTDEKETLREAVRRADDRLLATELVGSRRPWRDRLRKHLTFMRRQTHESAPKVLVAERARSERNREGVARER